MTEERPPVKVSVIVPIYNMAATLPACLDSLLAQTMQDFEAILVNDGSQDNSSAICHDYDNRFPGRFRVFDIPNGGVSTAYNLGYKAATGTYVIALDADDIVEPRWLDVLLRAAEQTNADIALCSIAEYSENTCTRIIKNFPHDGTICLTSKDEIEQKILLPLLKGSPDIHGYVVCCLIRRELLEAHDIRFPVHLPIKEDEIFLMDVFQWATRITAEDQPLYRYIRHNQSALGVFFQQHSDYKHEHNWRIYAEERVIRVRKGTIPQRFPGLMSQLILHMYLHEIQEICCEPGVRFFKRLKNLKKIAARIRTEHLRNMSLSERLFYRLIRHGWLTLPVACWLKRRKDEIKRSKSIKEVIQRQKNA